MGTLFSGGVLIYFLLGDYRENTAAAAAALNAVLFLMFNGYIHFERFHQLEISEEGGTNVANGHKHSHTEEPRQVQ